MALERGVNVDASRSVSQGEWLPLICEHLINHVGALPDHDAASKFWAIAGPRIAEVRDAATVREALRTAQWHN